MVEEWVVVRVKGQVGLWGVCRCDDVAGGWIDHPLVGEASWCSVVGEGESSCVSAVSSSVGLASPCSSVGGWIALNV